MIRNSILHDVTLRTRGACPVAHSESLSCTAVLFFLPPTDECATRSASTESSITSKHSPGNIIIDQVKATYSRTGVEWSTFKKLVIVMRLMTGGIRAQSKQLTTVKIIKYHTHTWSMSVTVIVVLTSTIVPGNEQSDTDAVYCGRLNVGIWLLTSMTVRLTSARADWKLPSGFGAVWLAWN